MIRQVDQLAAELWRAARFRAVAALILMAAFSLTEGVGIFLLFPLLEIAGVNLGGKHTAGRIAHAAAHAFGWAGIAPSLPILLAIFVLLMGFRAYLGRLQSDSIYLVEQRFEADLRLTIYRAISRASWLFVCRGRGSDFLHALSSEMARAGQAVFDLMLVAADVVLTALYILFAIVLAPTLTVLVLGAGGAIAWLLRARTRKIHQSGAEVSDSTAALFAAMTEHLGNLKLAKAYGAEDRNYAIFEELTRRAEAANLQAQSDQVRAAAWFELGSAIVLGALLYLAVEWLAVAPATVLILLVLFARIMPRFLAAFSRWQSLVGTIPAFENITAMTTRFDASAEPEVASVARAPTLQADLVLDRVNFAYVPGMPVLHDLTIAIPAGKMVALAGPSGAGKSTIADLAIGLLAPDGGSVSIDGCELSPELRRRWRGQIGYAASDTFLFHDTIRANLMWARPDAADGDLNQALDAASASAFVAALPNGLETVVGDRGMTLSQGERQRLAIARAWLRRPRLIVLDEALNALDTDTESRVLDALDNRPPGTTVLMIAHRLSTIRRADLIYVIEGGRVVEAGTFSALADGMGTRLSALRGAQALI